MKLRYTLGVGGWLASVLLAWGGHEIAETHSLKIRKVSQELDTELRNRTDANHRISLADERLTRLQDQLHGAKEQSEIERIKKNAVRLQPTSEKQPQPGGSPFVRSLLKKAERAQWLESELARHPAFEVPEISFVNETDWLEIADGLGGNPSQKQISDALKQLAVCGQRKFLSYLVDLGETTSLGQKIEQTRSIQDIKSFFQSASGGLEKIALKALDDYELTPEKELRKGANWGMRTKKTFDDYPIGFQAQLGGGTFRLHSIGYETPFSSRQFPSVPPENP
ncbi:MAG: hypothetical protein RLZZ142_1198 [Verrucomicrobiota bacterium]